MQCSLAEIQAKADTHKEGMNAAPSKYRHCGIGSASFALLMVMASAGPFVPPTEKLPPFRRDRLPLHEDAIKHLSHRLLGVLGEAPYETPEHRRTVAKALALTLALDPNHQKAKDQLAALVAGNQPAAATQEPADHLKNQIWDSLDWLSSPKAGKDGNSLASLLGETMTALYPGDPQSVTYAGKPENPAWKGWIAETVAFGKAPEIAKQEEPAEARKPDVTEGEEGSESNQEPEKPKPSSKSGILLEQARATTVINLFNKEKSVWLPEIVRIEMSATGDPKDDLGEKRWGFLLNLQANQDEDWKFQENIAQPIKNLLEREIGSLPERAEIRLRPDLAEDVTYSHRRNGSQITAAGFVLAHAALSGNRPNGTFIGEIKRGGGIGVPRYFWRSLMALTDGPGGRLIIPSAAEPHFINLLALEKPEFFFKYEVLVASSTEEYLILADPDSSGTYQETYNKFKIIRDTSAGNALGAYLNNRFVRERLQEIVNQAPYHLSAKILSMYGTTARPRYLTREALAAEIWRRTDVINEIAKIEDLSGIHSNRLARLNQHVETMRNDLANLDRYTDSRNVDLLRDAKDLVSSLRAFGKAFEGKGEMWEKYDEIYQERAVMLRKKEELFKKMAELTGDPLSD